MIMRGTIVFLILLQPIFERGLENQNPIMAKPNISAVVSKIT
jgi:hypothetical protein